MCTYVYPPYSMMRIFIEHKSTAATHFTVYSNVLIGFKDNHIY